MKTPLVPIALAAAALAAASAANLALAEHVQRRPYDVTHVPSGKAMRAVSLGHRTFVSDLYWLSTVQYVGEPKADQRGWDKLYPLVDLVTDLDPRHGYAYQTAGIVLSASGRIEEANRVLLKGYEKGPPRWTYPYYLSFNYWYYLGDYAKGAEWARIAARQPGASQNVSQLAVSLSSKSGTPEDALTVLKELRATVQDEVSAAALDQQMKYATLERDAQLLEKLAARFEQERGRPLVGLPELVLAGYLPSLPPDPFGGHYVWNPGDRRVRSSENDFRFSVREGAHPSGLQYKPPPQERIP